VDTASKITARIFDIINEQYDNELFRGSNMDKEELLAREYVKDYLADEIDKITTLVKLYPKNLERE